MKKYLMGFNFIPQIGYKRLQVIKNHFGNKLENAYKVPSKTLYEIVGIKKFTEYNPDEILEKVEKELEICKKKGISVLTIDDNDYPELLRELDSAPLVLYIMGKPECLKKPCVSIVGTRIPTDKGRKNAYNLASALSGYNVTVVSGFAKGIDTSAHEGAVNSNCPTAAVFGSGINVTYPKTNEKLRNKITEKGCLISEFPVDLPPHKINFPKRNRIIAGLSRVCVMVEGSLDSGALITSNIAFDLNRSVFAYPGPIDNDKYSGTNKLIKRNVAQLITCHNDLIDELSYILDLDYKEKNIKEKIKENPKNLSDIEKKIINLLDYYNPKHIDLLVEESLEPVNIIGQVLLSLELKGYVEQKPGKFFLRS